MEHSLVILTAAGVGFLSGAVPVTLAEATALGAAAIPSWPLRIAVLVAFTAGHVAGKALWYGLGTLESRVTRPSIRRWIDRARGVAATHPRLSLGVAAGSATVSLPPFHLMVIAAGLVRTPPIPLFLVAFAGRLVRFAAIAAFPWVLSYLWPR